jgi:hypothetical protein
LCVVFSGTGLCDELITRPEESSRLWRVVECDTETSEMRRAWPTGGGGGLSHQNEQNPERYRLIREGEAMNGP